MIKKHNQIIAILFPLIYFLLGNNLSVHILEIEGEFENRYTTALNAVLGPESFRIEIQVIEEFLKEKTIIPSDIEKDTPEWLTWIKSKQREISGSAMMVLSVRTALGASSVW